MNAKSVVEGYLRALKQKVEWRDLFQDEVTFVSHVVPLKRLEGKKTFLESTKRFYSMIVDLDIAALIAEGDRVCALTRYSLQVPLGPSFTTEVAEIFSVVDGKIASLDIYFDSSPFPK